MNTPHFQARNKDETIQEAAKNIIAARSYKKWTHFQLFDVEDEAAAEVAWPIVQEALQQIDPDAAARDNPLVRNIGVLARWEKHSFFRFWVRTASHVFRAAAVTGKRSNMKGTVFGYRDWALSLDAGIYIPLDTNIDLTLDHTGDLELARNICGAVALGVMKAILDRPHEYRLVGGNRTPRERMLNIPAVVTISLSKPVVHTIGHGNGGGWKMPEHDVRGHERRLKSGRVVWVTGHKRGDPNVARRTTYRIVP